RGQGADVHRLGGHTEEMRQEPSNLAIENANELRAAWDGDAQESFRRQTEGVLLVHRGHVVEPIEVRNRLQVGLVLDQLLSAAVQEPDVRITPLDHLAVKLEYEPQHAVCRGVLGPEVDRK